MKAPAVVEEAFERASFVLFTLEEILSPDSGDPYRREVYRLRTLLGQAHDRCRNREYTVFYVRAEDFLTAVLEGEGDWRAVRLVEATRGEREVSREEAATGLEGWYWSATWRTDSYADGPHPNEYDAWKNGAAAWKKLCVL